MTIGVLGWTFEALCCETATGYDRVVVKKALKRLEDEGIVEGGRERRPGFNVRVVKLAENFHARQELDALLRACVEAWPMYADSVNKAMDHLQPRTKEHLQRRGIVERDPWAPAKPGRDLAAIELVKRKERLLRDYRQLEKTLGRTPTSRDVVAFSGRVSKGIRDCWGGFRQFCAENNIAPDYRRAKHRVDDSNVDANQAGFRRRVRRQRKITPQEQLRARQHDCIVRYRRLVAQHGRDVTSAEINGKFDSNLYRSIRALWSTFAAFRAAAGLTDKRRNAVPQPNAEERQRCIAEYVALTSELGVQPNSAALLKHRPYLFKRIRWQWGSFADFGLEMQLPLRRHRNQHLPDEVRRERCIAEYRALSLRLGRQPGSHELQALTDGLYKRIWRLWGGFAAFRSCMTANSLTGPT